MLLTRTVFALPATVAEPVCIKAGLEVGLGVGAELGADVNAEVDDVALTVPEVGEDVPPQAATTSGTSVRPSVIRRAPIRATPSRSAWPG